MDKYIVIDKENKVVNVILWDGKSNWSPPEGCRVERNDEKNIGETHINTQNT